MKRNGFTLLEMMAVLLIMMLIMAAAGPAVSRFMKRSSLGMAVQNTRDVIRMARQAAITRNAFYAVDVNAQLGLIRVYDAGSTGTEDTADRLDKDYQVPHGIALTLPSSITDPRVSAWGGNAAGRMLLIFNSRGGLHTGTNDVSRIYLTDTNSSTAATDRTNTIRVYRGTGTTKVISASE